MLVSVSTFSKALGPIAVILWGIIVFLQPAIRVFVAVSIIALHPSLLSYQGLFSSMTIDSNLLQPIKAPSDLRLFTLACILRLVISHPQKA